MVIARALHAIAVSTWGRHLLLLNKSKLNKIHVFFRIPKNEPFCECKFNMRKTYAHKFQNKCNINLPRSLSVSLSHRFNGARTKQQQKRMSSISNKNVLQLCSVHSNCMLHATNKMKIIFVFEHEALWPQILSYHRFWWRYYPLKICWVK